MWPQGSSVKATPFRSHALPSRAGLEFGKILWWDWGSLVTPAALDWDIREASDLGLGGWKKLRKSLDVYSLLGPSEGCMQSVGVGLGLGDLRG